MPRLIRFRAALNGAEVKPGGPVGVEFAIYKEESGGVALWSEIQNVEVDATGHFTVLLGATKNGGVPPDTLGSGEPRWLSATPLRGQAQPRVRLVSVPYALRAEEALRIAGAPASEFVRKGDLADSVREAVRTIQSDGTTSHAIANATSGPTTFSGSTTNQIVYVQQTGTGKALVATAASGIGTMSTGGSIGIYGSATAATGTGVRGAGVIAGVYGAATAATGIGVQGAATNNTGGASIGVSGISTSSAGTGVSGKGSAVGVTGTATNARGIGVKGQSTDTTDMTGSDFGVQGNANDSTGAGVNGSNTAGTGPAFGVTGTSSISASAPLRATRSSHRDANSHGTSGVIGAQSASRAKKAPCCGARNASVFTPIRRVRWKSRPLVSSPVRCNSNSPAPRWPNVLQPMRVTSPAASRMAR